VLNSTFEQQTNVAEISVHGHRLKKNSIIEGGIPKDSIQVISRAVSVLRALEGEPDGLSLVRCAPCGSRSVDGQRIVDALRTEQFVIAASLTAGCVSAGAHPTRRFGKRRIRSDHASNHFRSLTGCRRNGGLVGAQGNVAVFTDQMQGVHRLRAVSSIGESFPLHCTANGKALLSLLSDEKVARLLKNPMPKVTPNTITKPAELLKAIESCRTTGIAIDNEEHTEGISGSDRMDNAIARPMGSKIRCRPPKCPPYAPRCRSQCRSTAAFDRLEQFRRLGNRVRRDLGIGFFSSRGYLLVAQ